MDHIKELYHLVKKQLDDRLKELEKEGKEPSKKKNSGDDDDDTTITVNDESSDESSLASSPDVSSSSPNSACALPPKHPLQQPRQHSPAAATDHGEGKKKKRRYIYAPSTIEILEASSSPLSISLYSSMKLPVGCLAEHDGCDDAELIARAKRCHEILKLSQQVKDAEAAARVEAEAEKKRDNMAMQAERDQLRIEETPSCSAETTIHSGQ